jgi:hypothetical protein
MTDAHRHQRRRRAGGRPGSRLRVAIFAVVLSGEAREAVPVDSVAGGGRGRAVGPGYEGGGAAAVFHP